MNIYAKRGAQVVFANPNSGYTRDQDLCSRYLKVGGVYTVKKTEVHSMHTDVYLEEIPLVVFNSVSFDDYPLTRLDS